MKRFSLCIPLIFLLSIGCLAQNSIETKVDEYIRAEMKAQQIPGVALAGQLKNQDWVSPSLNTTADGALYLTIYDMAKWDAALNTEKLLKKSSLEQMWTPVKLNDGKTEPYGFGWALGQIRGHRFIEHGGAWQGFKAQISRYVDDKLTVIVFANQIRTNQAKLAHGVAGLFNPDLAPN